MVDGGGQFIIGCIIVGVEYGLEQVVVGVVIVVVVYCVMLCFGYGIEVGDQCFDGLFGDVGLFDGGVEVVDVGLVVFVVVDFYCVCIEVWFKGVVGVGEWGK